MINNQLEELKLLLNITDDKRDKYLIFYLKKVNEMIRDYTRIYEPEILPTILESLAVFKVEGLIKSKDNNNTSGETEQNNNPNVGAIKSVSLGKANITFQDAFSDTAIFNFANKITSDALFTKEEKATMNRHRRMRFY